MIYTDNITYEEYVIRTVDLHDTVWFVAQDIAQVLGYPNASKMCIKLSNTDKMTKMVYIDDIYAARNMLLISAASVSKLHHIEKFGDWINKTFCFINELETKDSISDFKTASEFICAIVDVGLKFNVPKDILFSESVKLTMNLTGHDFINILKLSPHYNEEYHLC